MITLDKCKHELAEIGKNILAGSLVLLFFAVVAAVAVLICYACAGEFGHWPQRVCIGMFLLLPAYCFGRGIRG